MAIKTTKSGYKVDEKEKGLVHVELEIIDRDPLTGEKKSKPNVQKYDTRVYGIIKDTFVAQGFNHIEVLHNPSGLETTKSK